MINNILFFCFLTLCLASEHYNGEVFDLPEGSECTWNGLLGKCTSIQNCTSAQDAIRRKMHPPICSFKDRTPIVCCTLITQKQLCPPNYIPKDPLKDVAVDSRFNQTGSKARDNCMKYLRTLNYSCRLNSDRSLSENCNDEMAPAPLGGSANSHLLETPTSKSKRQAQNQRDHLLAAFHHPVHNVPAISHGAPALRRQYPHMALLGYGDDVQTAQWLCGGSVISEKYILTAAHCIASPAVGPVKFVNMGILKRSDSPDYWQTLDVKRVIPHPEYHPPSKYNDIALLETEQTISFNINVLPACLHLVPESDVTAEATGWGALGHRQGLADTLQTVKLQRYDAEKCSQLYPVHRHLSKGYDHSSQMCYGDREDPKDTCEGDSGGPLQVANEFLHCAYTLLGVTSYGRQCGITAGSGMYTRVYHYVPWIESIVWP